MELFKMKYTTKQLNKKDWKELYNLALDLIERHNKSLSFKELVEEYEGYFDYLVFDEKKEEYLFKGKFLINDEGNKISHKQFLTACLNEEEIYKREYSEEELKDFIKSIQKII